MLINDIAFYLQYFLSSQKMYEPQQSMKVLLSKIFLKKQYVIEIRN